MSSRLDRPWLCPEVVQTSEMDCGPAALSSFLRGVGLEGEYEELRRLCRTDIDGTSIDALEDICSSAGLAAEQIMVPVDHLLLPEMQNVPCITLIKLPSGFVHFVVVWRIVGSWVQLMDPARGRRWLHMDRFLEEVYAHSFPVPADGWREWAATPEFRASLDARTKRLKISKRAGDDVARAAYEDPSWKGPASLDAAIRLLAAMDAGPENFRRRDKEALLAHFAASGRADAAANGPAIPRPFWSVAPSPGGNPDSLVMKGAVLIRAVPSTDPEQAGHISSTPASQISLGNGDRPSFQPVREMVRLVSDQWQRRKWQLSVMTGAASLGVLLEALLLRVALDSQAMFRLPGQRLALLGGFVAMAMLLWIVDFRLTDELIRMGRHLETRLRERFLTGISELRDDYFSTRPVSDLAQRAHAVQTVRWLPGLAGRLGQSLGQLTVAIVLIALLFPDVAAGVVVAGILLLAFAAASIVWIREPDLRMRTHQGALARSFLDALLGLYPIRSHGSERSLRAEHEVLLTEWSRSAFTFVRRSTVMVAATTALGFLVGIAMVVPVAVSGGQPAGSVLLLAYLVLYLPLVGNRIIQQASILPGHRNVVLRLMEPLLSRERVERSPQPTDDPEPAGALGSRVAVTGVTLRLSGQEIFRDLSLDLPAGSHTAIVGASGAGKSSLLALLLGWNLPAQGGVVIDGHPIINGIPDGLRSRTVWLSPEVRLWNRSLLDNLLYGLDQAPSSAEIQRALETAELLSVVERLEDGLQTPLGEGGSRLSAGEGQRVRFARALLRSAPRLVLMDEPFRGLDRGTRTQLGHHARRHWSQATLVYITHDLAETDGFDRVLVLEDGRVVEDLDSGHLRQHGTTLESLRAAERRMLVWLSDEDEWRTFHPSATPDEVKVHS